MNQLNNNKNIIYQCINIMNSSNSLKNQKFDIIFDKGTFDSIALYGSINCNINANIYLSNISNLLNERQIIRMWRRLF